MQELDIKINVDLISFLETIRSTKFKKWIDAMKEELQSMEENKVYDIVDLLEDAKQVRYKWVFKTKHDSKSNIEWYNGRLIAKRFSQKDNIGYKETFSPISKKDSLRVIMALVGYFDLEWYQMDVKIVFLKGNLEKEVFVDQPEGFLVIKKVKWCVSLRINI